MSAPRSRLALALLAAGLGACSDVPASLLLTVFNGGDAPAPESVRVRVFDDTGVAQDYTPFAAPAPAKDGTLGTVVVYPRPRSSSGLNLRLQAQGMKGDTVISEGVTIAALASGQQNHASLTLSGVRGADTDRDGVPDVIDNCRESANPMQEPTAAVACGAPSTPDAGSGGSGGSGVVDAGRDTSRDTSGDAPGPGGEDAGSDATALPLGSPCSGSGACASGFCVDDVCCESACTDACRFCNLRNSAGRCSLVPAGQTNPRAGCSMQTADTCGFDGACNGSGACRRFQAGTVCRPASCTSAVERVLPGTCDGSGVCQPGRVQSCAPYACTGTACRTGCMVAPDCAPGNACNSGSCGRKPLGTMCSAGPECNSNNCVDGVCCDVADCSGACRSCAVPGAAGSCRNFGPNSDPRAPGCAMEATSTCGRTGKCDGAGRCQVYAMGTSCGTLTCSGATELLAPTCNGMNMCVPSSTRGCGNYTCNAGGTACRTTCTMDMDCGPAFFCLNGTCRADLTNGTSCTGNGQCQTGFCVDAHCCQTMTCAMGSYCGGNGGTCITKRALGASCNNGYECVNGFCNDGVCCATACTDTCRLCNLPGKVGSCELQETGRDNNATAPCASPRRCSTGGICR